MITTRRITMVNAAKKQAEKIRSSHGFQLAAGSVVAATSYYVFGKAVDVTSTAIAEMVKDAFNK